MKQWIELPREIQTDIVRPYYDYLYKRRKSLIIKRLMDFVLSVFLLIVLSPLFLVLAIWIKADSPGPVFFRQERVTRYGKTFQIFKFRTMVNDAEEMGTQVTVQNDARITGIGKRIRKIRLDEIPQLINILVGDMTFVGTRPEVKKYVECYTAEMYATLLLPAGVTSKASIEYKDEDYLLQNAENADEVYINQVLPQKMKYNLKAIMEFSLREEIKIMVSTIKAVLCR